MLFGVNCDRRACIFVLSFGILCKRLFHAFTLAMKISLLIGSGKKIGLFFSPFMFIGVSLNVFFPDYFTIGGPPGILSGISITILALGMTNWIWTIVLIMTKVPRKELIRTGPYALLKHPLYVGMAFLVIPWVGFLLNSWLGVGLGIILYVGTKLFAPAEEQALYAAFGKDWEDYCQHIRLPWL